MLGLDDIDYDRPKQTVYQTFQHPNMDMSAKDKNVDKKGCLHRFDMFDQNYIRPFLVYKFDRVKKLGMVNIEFADILNEYQAIKDEIANVDEDVLQEMHE